MKYNFILSCLILFFIFNHAYSEPFENINKDFNRAKSRVMIRHIFVSTQANLDFAAYYANPIRFDKKPVSPKKPEKIIKLEEITFGGAVSSCVNSINKTPLTKEEASMPLAWEPLMNKIWEIVKNDELAKIGSKIIGEKWADPSIFYAYQDIAACYLHKIENDYQMWVKIEFKPWVKFLDPSITCEANDGFKTIYAKLNIENINKDIRNKIFDWIINDYCKTILTKEQVLDWANILASYWYPKLNTDVVDLTGQTKWPTSDTEKEILKELKGLFVENPTVVIRGNPYGKKLYNVFIVDFKQQIQNVNSQIQVSNFSTSVLIDTSVSQNFIQNNKRFDDEVKKFGNYELWAKKDEAFRSAVLSYVKSLPPTQMGFKGKDDWLFFRGEAFYLNSGDLSLQPQDKNPLPHLIEFKKFLESKNISLIFVPVPNKSDIYFEKLPVNVAIQDTFGIIHPYYRKFLKDLQTAGIEVIDLLPAFLEAKKEDSKNKESIYQIHDTHWTSRGIQIAAQLIGNRIKQYSWYKDLEKNGIKYSLKDTFFLRLGDIVDKLPEADKNNFKPVQISAKQVLNPDKTPYKAANPDAPIMLIGDSFTGVFELIDCKSAGIGSHIAYTTGLPVDIITSWGGGPLVRDKFYRARKNNLDKKKVVIYMMVARDLYNYSQLWQPLEIK